MKHIRSTVIALFLLLIAVQQPRDLQAQGPAPVLIHYYAWWAPESVGAGKSPDWPPNPYHSWDTSVIQSHVAQVASTGVDGMIVAWYGPKEDFNQTETNFRVILDQASANGISALLSVDLGSAAWFTNTNELIDGLNYALNVHAQHPAYFRYNGKPVIFFWFQGRYSLTDWAYVRQQVDPNHNSIWIAEGAMPDAIGTFDGLYMYTISWSSNVAGTLAQWGNTTRGRGGVWVATAMPGWNNTYTQQSEKYIRERLDGAFYRESFSAAAASGPNIIAITSFNEWLEGTHVEPSANYGDYYLNLTREIVSEYKASGAVSGGGSSAPSVQPTDPPTEPTAVPVEPTAQPRPANTQEAVVNTPVLTATAIPAATIPPPTETAAPTATLPLPPTETLIPPPTAIADTGQLPVQADSQTPLTGALIRNPQRWIVAGGLLAAGLGFILMAVAIILAFQRRT